MKAEVKALIQNLGGELRDPVAVDRFIANVDFHCSTRGESWTGVDPLGQLRDVSETILAFEAIKWPGEKLVVDGYERWRAVEMYGASENYEVFAGDARRLLYQIADTDAQTMYAFDLLDKSEDPAVYYYDHEDPQDTFYREFPRLSLFLASLKTESVAASCKRSDEWESLIRASLSAKKGITALELAKEALRQHPAQPNFIRYVAVSLALANDDRKAEELYRLALEIDPQHGDSLAGLGLLLARGKKQDESEALLRRFVESHPDYAPAHYFMARGFAVGQRKAEMLEALKQALVLDSSIRTQMVKEQDFAAFSDDADFLALSKADASS